MPFWGKLPLRFFSFVLGARLAFSASAVLGDEFDEKTPLKRKTNVNVPVGWEQKPPAPEDGMDLKGELIGTFREKGSPNSPELTLQALNFDDEQGIDAYAANLRQEILEVQKKHPQLYFLERAKVITLNGRQFVKCVLVEEGQAMVSYHALLGRKAYTLEGIVPQGELERYQKAFEQIITGLEEKAPAQAAPRAGDRDKPGSEIEDLIQEGSRLLSEKQFDKAIERFKEALEKRPDAGLKAHLLVLLSVSYRQKGAASQAAHNDDTCFQKSLEYSREALAVNPTYWLAHANMAEIYMQMGDLEKADQSYKDAEKYTSPSNPAYTKLLYDHGMVSGMLKRKGQESSK